MIWGGTEFPNSGWGPEWLQTTERNEIPRALDLPVKYICACSEAETDQIMVANSSQCQPSTAPLHAVEACPGGSHPRPRTYTGHLPYCHSATGIHLGVMPLPPCWPLGIPALPCSLTCASDHPTSLSIPQPNHGGSSRSFSSPSGSPNICPHKPQL